MIRYVAGLVLCAAVSFVYSAARRDDPRRALREGLVIFGYVLASLVALAVVVYALCRLK
jgi:hypothetical protein